MSEFSAIAPGDATAAVGQDNWNNVLQGGIIDEHPSHFLDNAGTPTSVPWQDYGFSSASIVPTGNLLHGGSATGSMIIASPYPLYDLYVYIPGQLAPLSTGTTASVHLAGLPSDPPVMLDLSGAAVLSEATPTTAGNYVHFAGLTGATVNLFVIGPVVLAGLQFVAVPEAATSHLFAVGLVALALFAPRRF